MSSFVAVCAMLVLATPACGATGNTETVKGWAALVLIPTLTNQHRFVWHAVDGKTGQLIVIDGDWAYEVTAGQSPRKSELGSHSKAAQCFGPPLDIAQDVFGLEVRDSPIGLLAAAAAEQLADELQHTKWAGMATGLAKGAGALDLSLRILEAYLHHEAQNIKAALNTREFQIQVMALLPEVEHTLSQRLEVLRMLDTTKTLLLETGVSAKKAYQQVDDAQRRMAFNTYGRTQCLQDLADVPWTQ